MPSEFDRDATEFAWVDAVSQRNIEPTQAFAQLQPLGSRPDPDAWLPASLIEEDDVWWIRILIGPGGDVVKEFVESGGFNANDWQAYVRIQANPENIIRAAGIVSIT